MAIYELAYNLHLTVYDVMHGMEYTELQGWQDYFTRRPIGYREDSRTFMLLSAQGVKEKPESLFTSLAQIKSESETLKEGQISVKELQSSIFFQNMSGSIDGDSIKDIFNKEVK